MFTLDHIGIVVPSLAEAVPLYCLLLGVPAGEVEYHDVPTEQVRVATLKGNVTIELLEPTSSETGLAKFLAKRGAGFHHFSFAVPAPLETKLAELQALGLQLLDETPRIGADGCVFFVHPKSAGGILTEFVERG